jgi:hypothetical protein
VCVYVCVCVCVCVVFDVYIVYAQLPFTGLTIACHKSW